MKEKIRAFFRLIWYKWLRRCQMYYVGPGGSNENDGLTMNTRKLTLDGVEKIMMPYDTVYVSGINIENFREILAKDDADE